MPLSYPGWGRTRSPWKTGDSRKDVLVRTCVRGTWLPQLHGGLARGLMNVLGGDLSDQPGTVLDPGRTPGIKGMKTLRVLILN